MSTRLLTAECFDGRCSECVGYNGPAHKPNFYCDCPHHASVPQDSDVQNQEQEKSTMKNQVEEEKNSSGVTLGFPKTSEVK